MAIPPYASWMLEQEARALLTRLARVKPFALQETMLPAAGLLPASQIAIETYLTRGRRKLRRLVNGFLRFLRTAPSLDERRGRAAAVLHPAAAIRRRADAVRSVQRRDHAAQRERDRRMAVGLDVVSADALQVAPAGVRCAAGHLLPGSRRRRRDPPGAHAPAGRRRQPGRDHQGPARTDDRQRHRVVAHSRSGHQAAALLGLVESLRPEIRRRRAAGGRDAEAWRYWDRWISEIVADFWSVARVGVGSTMGLMGVVSLPRVFVFRITLDDPHPSPWIRVKVSAAHRPGAVSAAGVGTAVEVCGSRTTRRTDCRPTNRSTSSGCSSGRFPSSSTLLVDASAAVLRGRSLVEALDTQELRAGAAARPADAVAAARPGRCISSARSSSSRPSDRGERTAQITPEEESTVLAKTLRTGR